jgi:hypothetical protein
LDVNCRVAVLNPGGLYFKALKRGFLGRELNPRKAQKYPLCALLAVLSPLASPTTFLWILLACYPLWSGVQNKS